MGPSNGLAGGGSLGHAVSSLGFLLQLGQIRNPPPAQTLPRVRAQFDLRLIEPASVLGSVMDELTDLSEIPST